MLPEQKLEQMLQWVLHISEDTCGNPDPLVVVAAASVETYCMERDLAFWQFRQEKRVTNDKGK